jgi:hypothetical protein
MTEIQSRSLASFERRVDDWLSRHARLLACAFAYLVLLALLVRAWTNDPYFMHMGRDGMLSLWLLRTHAEWGSAASVTLLNPFQGMVSMLLPMNPSWIPASFFSVRSPESVTGWVLSSIAYHAEFTASMILLGRCLGFSSRQAFLAALWLTVLLFPPFNYAFGLHAWLGTAPIYAHTLALGNVMAAILAFLGRRSERGAREPAIANVALAGLFSLTLVAYVLASPLYNAGMLAGYALLFGGIVVATPGLRQRGWQCLALVAGAATLWGMGFGDFIGGVFRMSGRFAGETTSVLSLLEIQTAHALDREALDVAKVRLCAAGILCGKFSFRWAITGSWWLHIVILLGGAYFAAGASGRVARLGGIFAGIWLALLVYWIAVALGVLRPGPLGAVYLFLPLYPMLGILSLEGMRAIVVVTARVVHFPRLTVSGTPKLGRITAILTFLVVVMWAGVLTGWRNSIKEPGLLRLPVSSPLIDLLRRETALEPGGAYRGSVVTVLGSSAAPPPDDLSLTEAQRKSLREQGSLSQTAVQRNLLTQTGNSHSLLDLWWFSIPTLDEYGQAISLPLKEYTKRFLTNPDEPAATHFISVSRIQPDVLQILGVRFVLTDGRLPSSIASARGELPLDGVVLRLYELRAPNLGNVSPTKIVAARNADEVFRAIAADPKVLRRTAFVAGEPNSDLVPAQAARMTMIRGGVTVAASSRGTSALLLPLQFSNCLSVEASQGEQVRIVRANLLHTLIVFRGPVEATIRWKFGFGASSSCRLKDVADLKRLGF